MIRNTGSTTFSYDYDTQSNQKMEWSTTFTAPGWGLAAGSTTWSLGGLLWKNTAIAGNTMESNLSADGFYETRTMTIPWSMDSGSVMDATAIAVATDFLTVKRVLSQDNSQRTYPLGYSDAPIEIGDPQWGYSNDFIGATGIPSTADATLTCDSLAGNLAYAHDGSFISQYNYQGYSIGTTSPNLLYQQKLYSSTQKITDVVSNVTEDGIPLYPVGMKNLMGCAPAVTGTTALYNGIRVYVTYTRWTLAQYRVDIKTTPNPSPRHPYGFFVGTPYRLPPTLGQLSGEAPYSTTSANAIFGAKVFGGSPPTYGPSSPLESYPAGGYGFYRYKQDYFQAWVEYYEASRDAFVDAGDWDKYYVYTEIFPDTQIGYIDFPDASFKVTAGRAEGAATPTSGRCGCVPVLPDTVDVTLSATGLTQIDGPTISIPQSFIDALNKTITMTRRTDYVYNRYGNNEMVAFYSVGPIDGPSYPTATSDCPWDGTYWATLKIKCDSASIHLGLHTPYANEFSDTPGATDIESEGYYLGGVGFEGAIGASINAICSGASTTFEFAPVDATVFAVNWNAPPPPGYEFVTFSVSGINTVVTFPPLWKPNAAWTAAAFSGGGTAPSHFVKASLVIAGYTGVRPAITARRAGVFHITATNVHYDYWFRCYRNGTQVIEYGSDDTPDEGGDTGSITRTFSISVGDVITLGDPDDYNVCTNLQIWWTAT